MSTDEQAPAPAPENDIDALRARVLRLEAQIYKMAEWLLNERRVMVDLQQGTTLTSLAHRACEERISRINALLDGSAGESLLADLVEERNTLREAIRVHHSQKADDRCVEDDDRLYAAAGLPPCDRRVGSKEEMLKNCARFIERRCEGGGWPTYRELEADRDRLKTALTKIQQWDCLNPPDPTLCHDHPWLKRTVDDALAGRPYDMFTQRDI